MRIGVDVGGTNTDAVLMNGSSIIASHKAPTTERVEDGIKTAIQAVLQAADIDRSKIALVSVGTTHFTNAFVQRQRLEPVGILRIGLPAAQALPPLSGWPNKLAAIVCGQVICVNGGTQVTGQFNSPLDEIAVAKAARMFKQQGLKYVSISSVFAPVNAEQENRAAEIMLQEYPDVVITKSSKFGRLGLIERENAGIMNASLVCLAEQTVSSLKAALSSLDIGAPFFITQNDGTLMDADLVSTHPVFTFASGPTNSIRGAAYLSGIKNAIVADIGGTTTDIGVLTDGFPRESSIPVDIGGTRTNFRMPDILALGLGGGSLVSYSDHQASIGPSSVGQNILKRASVFGGDSLTATDIAVAAGYADIGDKKKVKYLTGSEVELAVDRIHSMLEDGIDRVRTDAKELPLILIGGGAILINRQPAGVSDVITHADAGVANAIGACMAQVGGETESVFFYEELNREHALERAIQAANKAAVLAGADPDTLKITELEEIPLDYIPKDAVRVRAKVTGDLKMKEEAK